MILKETHQMTHRLGIFAWFGYQAPIKDRLHAIADAGFDATCLWLGEEEEAVRSNTAEKMVHCARNLGLYIDNVHAELRDCNLIWSDSQEDGNLIFQEYLKGIRFCSEHEIARLVIHVCMADTPSPINQTGLDLLGRLLDSAEKEEVVLAIENTRRRDYLNEVFSAFDSKYLGLCLDTGHDHLFGNPPLAILNDWGHLLSTVHLADNSGEKDDHWIPGDGQIEWQTMMNSLSQHNYSGTILLEVYPQSINLETPPQFLKRVYDKALHLRSLIPR